MIGPIFSGGSVADHGRVLDIGCGTGSNGYWYRQHGAREIVGVEIDPASADRASAVLDRVVCEPIETALGMLEGTFDLIVCADVLEHLVDPWSVVADLGKVATQNTVLAVSMPNIRFSRRSSGSPSVAGLRMRITASSIRPTCGSSPGRTWTECFDTAVGYRSVGVPLDSSGSGPCGALSSERLLDGPMNGSPDSCS